jgi:hypothetical protein
MLFKPEVNTQGTRPAIWYALGAANQAHWELTGHDVTVTSLNDGQHMKTSLHYQGMAADIRTKDLTPAEATRLHKSLWLTLFPQGFDVLDEGDHIHIEYDPKANCRLP